MLYCFQLFALMPFFNSLCAYPTLALSFSLNVLDRLPIDDPVTIFLVIVGIMLIAPLLFERLGLPGIVGRPVRVSSRAIPRRGPHRQ